MKFLDIDVSKCATVEDFLVLFFRAIGAPDWHGTGPDAFVDSTVWGGVNALKPPYTVRVTFVRRIEVGNFGCCRVPELGAR